MIKEITEKFGSFDRNSLKERFKDDPEGYEQFTEDVISFWETIREKYLFSHTQCFFDEEKTERFLNMYNYIPNEPIDIWFDDECCSIFENGLLILYDDCKQDKTPFLTGIEFDIEDDHNGYELFDVCEKEEFVEKWNEVPYWEEYNGNDILFESVVDELNK